MNAIETAHMVMPTQDDAYRHAALHFPATEQLLVEGGDTRIALNPASGANKYGCRPRPDADIAAFGSATSTTISDTAFFAAKQLRNRLAQRIATEDAADVYADEMNRIRHKLIALNGLNTCHGLDIVFAASGTDVHLIAAQLSAQAGSTAVRILIIDPAETGSGVPAALSGRHFGAHSALGEAVTQDLMLAKYSGNDVVSIPLRLADGTPRASADIDADFEQQVVIAAAAGQRVLLTMVDVSKTGMIAPSVACAVGLSRRFPDALDVLVDACQFRIAPATLQAYLEQGFMVGVTGSKFITGPSFSGALLIPENLSKKLRAVSVADKLQAYCTRADWPANWGMARQLGEEANFGLLLRWESAIQELRAFRCISNAVTTHFLRTFAEAIHTHLASNLIFEALPVPELQRHPLAATSWDDTQTIFPFLLFRPVDAFTRVPLNSAETAQIYLALQHASLGIERVQLAQPVACGTRDGISVSALRMCVSSRLVVEAAQHNGRDEQVVIKRALRALDKVAQLVQAAAWR
ncbi:MAG: hypothetical protein FD173_1527 [Gallionellaceae bacterium]|nr:MAG: hypothetical protein FD173_1527 [Gallionellaceae bacterium]